MAENTPAGLNVERWVKTVKGMRKSLEQTIKGDLEDVGAHNMMRVRGLLIQSVANQVEAIKQWPTAIQKWQEELQATLAEQQSILSTKFQTLRQREQQLKNQTQQLDVRAERLNHQAEQLKDRANQLNDRAQRQDIREDGLEKLESDIREACEEATNNRRTASEQQANAEHAFKQAEASVVCGFELCG